MQYPEVQEGRITNMKTAETIKVEIQALRNDILAAHSVGLGLKFENTCRAKIARRLKALGRLQTGSVQEGSRT